MAYSPTPHPATLSGGLLTSRRLSPTPPLAQQPLSKRDKKRSTIEIRLKEITINFTMNRDVNLRNQLNALSRDIHYINQADPYQYRPLDDSPDDLSMDMSGAPGGADGDNRMPLGKHALSFVNTINDAMEERDANLTETHMYFEKTLERFRMDYDFAIQVAEAEEQALQESVRNRVISIIQAKKRNIQKEKDLLDNADSNTLLYNSSGFTTTQPGSPGGSHNNRKTRHTRHHRGDLDGEPAEPPNKRKRKAADLDNESPAPALRNVGEHDVVWDKSKDATVNGNDNPEDIKSYFSAKELTVHYRGANSAVARVWAERRSSPQPNGDSAGTDNGDTVEGEPVRRGRRRSNDSGTEPVEHSSLASVLAAPAMERSGSYATRSARNLHTEPAPTVAPVVSGNRENGAIDPRRLYGIGVLDALAARTKVASSKDVEAPFSSSLSAAEIAEDAQLMARLMAEP